MPITNAKHKIILNDKRPVVCKPFRIPEVLKEKVQSEIKRLLDEGIIRRSSSSYTSPAFPVIKRDQSIRLVIDYRTLNNKIIKVGYPIPSITEQLIYLHGSNYFSLIDLA